MSFEVGPILCAVCGKPVDSWVVEDRVDLHGFSLRVKCHGAEDSMTFHDRDFYDAENAYALRAAIAKGGTAFTKHKIGHDADDRRKAVSND